MPLRVAAYCRVSTDREDQANSLSSQKAFFRRCIEARPDWSFLGIFADEGLSGTSTRGREAFHRMIEAARAGALDLILTKEVSRFARNTVDTLRYTRCLKEWGVGVLFLSDNIDTRENDGELRLTIMASIAQEESRKTSARVKWGQQRRMEAGVVFGNDSTYGFETRGGRLTVRPAEAEVIRLIFHKFLAEGKGTYVIARELSEAGIPPPRTVSGVWSSTMIHRILQNEKHAGDLLQKKYITPDYLTHKKIKNRGQEETVYLRGHHEAIVSREAFEAAQRELGRRQAARAAGSKYSGRCWCSGKIRCGACGSRFTPRTAVRADGTVYRTWGCHSRVHRAGPGAGCDMRMVNHKTLAALAQYALDRLAYDAAPLTDALLEDLRQVRREDSGAAEAERLRAEEATLRRKKERLLDAFLGGQVSGEELSAMKQRYDRALAALAERLRQAEETQRLAEAPPDEEALRQALQGALRDSEALYRETVESITVYRDFVELRLRCVAPAFRLRYTVHGRGEGYTTVIERCELVE